MNSYTSYIIQNQPPIEKSKPSVPVVSWDLIKKRSMTYEDEHVIKIGKDFRKDIL